MKYDTPRMARLWDRRTTLEMWHLVECEVLQAQAKEGMIPEEWVSLILDTPTPSVEAWQEAANHTGHEVTGYLRATGLEHIHIGLTSSDLVDTANAMRIRVSNAWLTETGRKLLDVMIAMGDATDTTIRLARTHGQPATADTLGRRVRVLAQQVERCLTLPNLPGKISGPLGNYHTVSAAVEERVLEGLALWNKEDPWNDPYCSQIVPRDFYSRWAWAMSDLISSCGAIGLEVRLMATHGEAQEGRGNGYTGSSAMPHKRNPSQSERLSGLARIGRSAALAISEGIEQWQDRDLAHSSVERVYMPMLCGLADYSLHLTKNILINLELNPSQMRANLWKAGKQAQSHYHQTHLQQEGVPYQDARTQTHEWVTTKEEEME